MMREDVLKVLGIIKIAFPHYYKDVSREQAEHVVSLWGDMFADYDPALVAMAVKTIIASDPNPFPPSIGRVRAEADQIKKLIHSLALGGYTLNDYTGDGGTKYPLSVREAITDLSKEKFKLIHGCEFISQRELRNRDLLQGTDSNGQKRISTEKKE